MQCAFPFADFAGDLAKGNENVSAPWVGAIEQVECLPQMDECHPWLSTFAQDQCKKKVALDLLRRRNLWHKELLRFLLRERIVPACNSENRQSDPRIRHDVLPPQIRPRLRCSTQCLAITFLRVIQLCGQSRDASSAGPQERIERASLVGRVLTNDHPTQAFDQVDRKIVKAVCFNDRCSVHPTPDSDIRAKGPDLRLQLVGEKIEHRGSGSR